MGIKFQFWEKKREGTNRSSFSWCSGAIAGAKITEYLLEKSRIVTHAADERNYHVFYEMLKGLRPEEKERYGLTAADNYFYLNQVRLGEERRDPRKKKKWSTRIKVNSENHLRIPFKSFLRKKKRVEQEATTVITRVSESWWQNYSPLIVSCCLFFFFKCIFVEKRMFLKIKILNAF